MNVSKLNLLHHCVLADNVAHIVLVDMYVNNWDANYVQLCIMPTYCMWRTHLHLDLFLYFFKTDSLPDTSTHSYNMRGKLANSREWKIILTRTYVLAMN